MFLYTIFSTMTLTWMILIRPNNYTTASNALDWLLMMSLFVFLPMTITALDRYHRRLERARARIGRQNRSRLDKEAQSRYRQDVFSDSYPEMVEISMMMPEKKKAQAA